MENMDLLYSIFSDGMLWSTIPLLIVTGVGEAHMALSATGHMLAQTAILLVFVGWVWFWFYIGEYCRQRYQLAIQDFSQPKLPVNGNSNPPVVKILVEQMSLEDPEAVNVNNERNQRKYASNH